MSFSQTRTLGVLTSLALVGVSAAPAMAAPTSPVERPATTASQSQGQAFHIGSDVYVTLDQNGRVALYNDGASRVLDNTVLNTLNASGDPLGNLANIVALNPQGVKELIHHNGVLDQEARTMDNPIIADEITSPALVSTYPNEVVEHALLSDDGVLGPLVKDVLAEFGLGEKPLSATSLATALSTLADFGQAGVDLIADNPELTSDIPGLAAVAKNLDLSKLLQVGITVADKVHSVLWPIYDGVTDKVRTTLLPMLENAAGEAVGSLSDSAGNLASGTGTSPSTTPGTGTTAGTGTGTQNNGLLGNLLGGNSNGGGLLSNLGGNSGGGSGGGLLSNLLGGSNGAGDGSTNAGSNGILGGLLGNGNQTTGSTAGTGTGSDVTSGTGTTAGTGTGSTMPSTGSQTLPATTDPTGSGTQPAGQLGSVTNPINVRIEGLSGGTTYPSTQYPNGVLPAGYQPGGQYPAGYVPAVNTTPGAGAGTAQPGTALTVPDTVAATPGKGTSPTGSTGSQNASNPNDVTSGTGTTAGTGTESAPEGDKIVSGGSPSGVGGSTENPAGATVNNSSLGGTGAQSTSGGVRQPIPGQAVSSSQPQTQSQVQSLPVTGAAPVKLLSGIAIALMVGAGVLIMGRKADFF